MSLLCCNAFCNNNKKKLGLSADNVAGILDT